MTCVLSKKLHIHLWDHDNQPDRPIEEIDAELKGVYDEYDQYGFQYFGFYYEIRVPR